MHRTAVVLALAACALLCPIPHMGVAQTGATPPAAISAYYRLAGNASGPYPYQWLIVDPPLSIYVDGSGSPHLNVAPTPGPVGPTGPAGVPGPTGVPAPVPFQTDVFTVNCAASQYCAAGVPQTVFATTHAAAAFWGVFRNGLFLTAPADYTYTTASGIATVTFTGQAIADQDLIVLFYSAT